MRQLNVLLAALLLFPVALAAVDVQDTILRRPTLEPRKTCGSTMACSVVAAVTLCDCRFDRSLNRVLAKATLRLLGTIYYFRGSFRTIAERPRDASVVDQDSAIRHEYAYHIDPAVNAVDGFLARFESASFATIADCVLAGSDLAKIVGSVFRETLAATQRAERAQ